MEDIKFVGELRFPGLGVIDRRYKLDALADRLEAPVCCVLTRLRTDFSETLDLERFVFRLMGMYPSGFNSLGKVTEMTGIYELQEIKR